MIRACCIPTGPRAGAVALSWLLAVLVAPAASAADAPATFYISPKGNDLWSGTLAEPNADRTDGPRASLAGARDAVRALKAKGPLAGAVRVKIAGGLYLLAEPVTFTPADSGTPTSPVIYEASPGERPIFSGGVAIGGFEAGADGLWRVRVPEVADGRWSFEQLFVDDRRAIRARDPDLAMDPSADVRDSVAAIKQDLARSFHTMKSRLADRCRRREVRPQDHRRARRAGSPGRPDREPVEGRQRRRLPRLGHDPPIPRLGGRRLSVSHRAGEQVGALEPLDGRAACSTWRTSSRPWMPRENGSSIATARSSTSPGRGRIPDGSRPSPPAWTSS